MSDETLTVEAAPNSTFTKAVKNIRSLIKKGKVQVRPDGKNRKGKRHAEKSAESSPGRVRPVRASKEKTGAVVYLSHLPHGFEEKGIRSYLEQFGKVRSVRLARSEKTGRGRGFAFVEFEEEEIAKIVVETMNNYLMYKRLIKAEIVGPPSDEFSQRPVGDSCPVKPENTKSALCRRSFLRKRDRPQTARAEQRTDAHTRRSLRRLQKKLAARGINYQFKATKTEWKPVMSSELPAEAEIPSQG